MEPSLVDVAGLSDPEAGVDKTFAEFCRELRRKRGRGGGRRRRRALPRLTDGRWHNGRKRR